MQDSHWKGQNRDIDKNWNSFPVCWSGTQLAGIVGGHLKINLLSVWNMKVKVEKHCKTDLKHREKSNLKIWAVALIRLILKTVDLGVALVCQRDTGTTGERDVCINQTVFVAVFSILEASQTWALNFGKLLVLKFALMDLEPATCHKWTSPQGRRREWARSESWVMARPPSRKQTSLILWICICVCVFVYLCICVFVYLCICVFVNVFVYMYFCVCIFAF